MNKLEDKDKQGPEDKFEFLSSLKDARDELALVLSLKVDFNNRILKLKNKEIVALIFLINRELEDHYIIP